jgi:thioredoxin-like negative regulator of GroEL
LNYVTKNRRAVVHFYHEEFQKCKIVEKHLRIIAGKHPESVFLYIDSKKAPFFVTKLAIRVLPCVCLFINGVLRDKIVGF